MQIGEQLKQRELEDKGCLTSPVASIYLQNPVLYVIPELVPLNKEMILQDRLSICGDNFQKQKSSKTSDLALILKERVCSQSWKDACGEIQSHLLSPTEIDCADLVTKSSSILSIKMVEKSWFSTKLSTVPNVNSQKT